MAFYGTSATGAALDRAQEVHREGGRGRLQEGAGGRGAVQVRVVSAGDRARARSVPRLLAQGAVGEAHRHAQHSRREHARRRRQDRRGGHRVSLRRRDRRGAPTHARRQDHGAPALRHLLARLPRPVGPEVAMARSARPSGREPRHRSQRDQPGRDAGLRQADRWVRAARVRLRAQGRAAAARSRRAKQLLDRGGLSQRLRRG